MRAEKPLHIDLYATSDQPIFERKLLVAKLEVAHSEGSPNDPELISNWLNNDSNNLCLEHSVDRDQNRVVTALDEPCCTRPAALSKGFLFAFLDCVIRNSAFDADLKPGNPLSIVVTFKLSRTI
jgi:hypothetical protein